eukprot:Platyproteum_vivax@DN10481_c0_g1_i1.p1
MSYLETRRFIELMRVLRYPRIISISNFLSPNFELVAEILDFLVHRYDSKMYIPDDISTEALRVEFITTVANVFNSPHLKLNLNKLYQANSYAVKEMLKIAEMLANALRSTNSDVLNSHKASHHYVMQNKIADIKKAKALSSRIIENGSMLFDLLENDPENAKDRADALSFVDTISHNSQGGSEVEYIEQTVLKIVEKNSINVSEVDQACTELEDQQKLLDAKIKKKRQELERSQKRLEILQKVRPAFEDEYIQLEDTFIALFKQYVDQHRNLDFLNYQLSDYKKDEENQIEENNRSMKRLQQRLQEEELRVMQGDAGLYNSADKLESDSDD